MSNWSEMTLKVVKNEPDKKTADSKDFKNRRIFPNDESAMKIVYLAIQKASQKWTMPVRNWKPAMNRFAIEYENRFPTT